MLKKTDIHLKILQADSMWTKREFPSEPFDHIPPQQALWNIKMPAAQ